MNGTEKIPLQPTKMTRAANQPDGLIDPVGMNAHRAVPRIIGRGVCEIGLDPVLWRCSSVNASVLQSLSDTGSSSASGLAAMLAPAIINQIVDAYVTPQGMANLVGQGRQAKGNDGNSRDRNTAHEIDFSRIQYAFFDGGPFTFKVQILNERQNEEPFGFLFKWDGTWRLKRLVLPTDTLANAKSTFASTPDSNRMTESAPVTNPSSRAPISSTFFSGVQSLADWFRPSETEISRADYSRCVKDFKSCKGKFVKFSGTVNSKGDGFIRIVNSDRGFDLYGLGAANEAPIGAKVVFSGYLKESHQFTDDVVKGRFEIISNATPVPVQKFE